jgi:hypothetical protein
VEQIEDRDNNNNTGAEKPCGGTILRMKEALLDSKHLA